MLKSMSVLSMIGLIDSISYMAVAPSLIFYVLQVGGTKEQYGLVMSAFSFASFCGKPIYGIWVDKGGNKFRVPYFASFMVAIVGALLYFLANGYQDKPSVALSLILIGRLLSGFGGANQALGYAYIASVVPQDQQTRTNTLLAMTRIIGMALGPLVNICLGFVESEMSIFGLTLPLDPLNAVGLLLAIGNLLTVLVVYFALEEPPEKEKKLPDLGALGAAPARKPNLWEALTCLEILLPIFILLVVNSSFQLIETALPPAAKHGLDWGPVATSGVLGSTSIVIFAIMTLVMYLSSKKVSDLLLVGIGNSIWIFGGAGMYFLWTYQAPVWHYVVPVMVSCAGFPFIASSNRSNFTKAVMSKPELESSQAMMQAVLSMAASVAGFVTPGLVAAYVIRTPDQVEASDDKRELTPWALYVCVFPLFILIGLYQLYRKQTRLEKEEAGEGEDGEATEATRLMRPSASDRRRSSVVTIDQTFSRQSEVARRVSVEIMGMTGYDTNQEKIQRETLLEDLEELVKLGEMDFEDEEN